MSSKYEDDSDDLSDSELERISKLAYGSQTGHRVQKRQMVAKLEYGRIVPDEAGIPE